MIRPVAMTGNMKQVRDLDAVEIRVLGALLEKEQTTPDYYPLTVNSLIAACNQKSNRDPVTTLTETEIVEALDDLRVDVLAWRTDGARAEKWSQSISRRLELDPEEKAVLTLLMLRGTQTAGELRSRSGRLHAFDSVREVEAALRRLANEDRGLAAELPRRPGQKENRWCHLLAGGAPEEAEPASPAHAAPAPAGPRRAELAERVEKLETTVARLVEDLEELTRRLGG